MRRRATEAGFAGILVACLAGSGTAWWVIWRGDLLPVRQPDPPATPATPAFVRAEPPKPIAHPEPPPAEKPRPVPASRMAAAQVVRDLDETIELLVAERMAEDRFRYAREKEQFDSDRQAYPAALAHYHALLASHPQRRAEHQQAMREYKADAALESAKLVAVASTRLAELARTRGETGTAAKHLGNARSAYATIVRDFPGTAAARDAATALAGGRVQYREPSPEPLESHPPLPPELPQAPAPLLTEAQVRELVTAEVAAQAAARKRARDVLAK